MVAVRFVDMGDNSERRDATLRLVSGIAGRIHVAMTVTDDARSTVFSHGSSKNDVDSPRRYWGSSGGVRLLLYEVAGRTVDAELYSSGGLVRAAEAGEVTDVIAEFLQMARESEPDPTSESVEWAASTERLLHHLANVLDQRSQLVATLERALHDRDVAEARVAELEALYDALRRERYETKEQTNKTFLVLVATAIFTLLGPIGGELVADKLRRDIDGAKHASTQVQVDCGDVTIELPLTNPLPRDPAA